MLVRFWGVRGSVAYATPESIGHGCNTPCVEVVDERTNRRLILDAGSGLVGLSAELSAALSATLSGASDVSILLTHYHWDHLHGLPFFAPLYQSGRNVTIWAPELGPASADVEKIFGPPFFPVTVDRLSSRPRVERIAEGETTIDGFQISAQRLNHPGGSLAYRIRGATGDLVYATDHEFGNAGIDDALRRFASGASHVILDSHLSPAEVESHRGRGHSDWQRCARFASECRAGTLWLFHHKPGRSDADVARFEAEARKLFRQTNASKEGVTFVV
ncbi:MAG: MBL fold metallo-hydrolase [Acidobacteria bacterium]|nr:MBL fold metallo-hydrolase [Acidobacteriota bacterium]